MNRYLMFRYMLFRYLKYGGIAIVFSWFFFGGIGHFTATDFFVSIVPPWWPWPLAAVYISGVFEIVLALMLLHPASRSIAGWGLIALTLAVTPANVHMWLHPESFPEVEPAFLSIRLVIQVFLLMLIWWATRPQAEPPTAIIDE